MVPTTARSSEQHFQKLLDGFSNFQFEDSCSTWRQLERLLSIRVTYLMERTPLPHSRNVILSTAMEVSPIAGQGEDLDTFKDDVEVR